MKSDDTAYRPCEEKKPSHWGECLLILFSILVSYAVIDEIIGALIPLGPIVDPYIVARINHPSYRREDFYSEAFLAESAKQPGGWDTPEHTRLIFPHEFHGQFFNVDVVDGTAYRRTNNINNPTRTTRSVLLLGGSTIYDSEVPDQRTVASYLAHELNARSANNYYVTNAGVTSVNSSQELERLEYELAHGKRPNIVVVFDGWNDIGQGIYFRNPTGVMFSHDQKKNTTIDFARLYPLLRFLPLNIYDLARRRRELVELRSAPEHMNNKNTVEELSKEVKRIYLNNVTKMNELSHEYTFSFYVFLQPALYTGHFAKTTDDLALATALTEKLTPLSDRAMMVGYPLLKDGITELQREGVRAFDLTDIFDAKDENIFLDGVHVNSLGNKLIAKAIAAHVLSEQ